MTGRMWLALAALMATSMGLAGCIEAFDQFDPEGAGITAMEDRDLADNAAAAWHPEAFLLGAASLETADLRAGVPLDDAPGDGRAAFWYYAYGAPETEDHRLFRVTQDGQVTVEEKLPPMMRGLEFERAALDGWTIDSDAAVAAVAATESVADVFGAGNLSVLSGVGMAPDKASWLVTALSDDGFAVALVDAKTGEVEVQDVEMADLPPMPPGADFPVLAAMAPPVHIEDEGTLDDDERTRDYAFEAVEGMVGELTITADSSLPHEYLRYWIYDVEREEQIVHGALRNNGDDTHTALVEIEKGGDYLLVVRHSGYVDWVSDELLLGEIDFELDLLLEYAGPGAFLEPDRPTRADGGE